MGPRGRTEGRVGGRPGDGPPELWLFGLHAVRAALENPRRRKRRLIVTLNAEAKLEDAIAAAGVAPERGDARRFPAPLDPSSVHQGAALLADPLDWGGLEAVAAPAGPEDAPIALLLDRVTDPHNVGAVLRSAEALGARAVIAPRRHSAPETGALAKAASGALERQPYLREANLARAMEAMKTLGYRIVGLDGSADATLAEAVAEAGGQPLALALGAEGAGLRELTRESCDRLARIPSAGPFASLNVSNAAAIALYAARARAG